MSNNREKHHALAAALTEQIERVGLKDDPLARDFIQSAFMGSYAYSGPVSPQYIGMTRDEFEALRALIYN